MPQLTITAEDVCQIDTLEQLCELLVSTFAPTQRQWPPIVSVNDLHGQQLDIGVAEGEAFLHITPEGGNPPYMITVGSPERQGVIDFLLHGDSHTQIDCRHLISFEDALAAIRVFWRTCELSSNVDWEEV